jgi:two-component system chemotaxis response regulator CheY
MKILIVDDSPYMLELLTDILTASGFELAKASSGEEALTRYSEVNPDIVLMDILMPGMDGISATRNILLQDPNAKIVVVTAVAKNGLNKECLKAGAIRFIPKPFKIKELISTINSAMSDDIN